MTTISFFVAMLAVMMVSIISFAIGLAVGVWINIEAKKAERKRPDLKVVK